VPSGTKRLALPVRVAVEGLDPAQGDLRAGQAGVAQAVPHVRGQRGHVEVTVGDHGEVGAAFGLADALPDSGCCPRPGQCPDRREPADYRGYGAQVAGHGT